MGGGAGRGVADCDFVGFRFPVALEEGRDIEKGAGEVTRGNCACEVFCTSSACEGGGSRVLKPPNGKDFLLCLCPSLGLLERGTRVTYL